MSVYLYLKIVQGGVQVRRPCASCAASGLSQQTLCSREPSMKARWSRTLILVLIRINSSCSNMFFVTLYKLLNPSVPQFFHLSMEMIVTLYSYCEDQMPNN